MGAEWLVTMKPSFTNEWLALPPKESHQVLEKIKLLEQDPTPDAKVKKQLKHIDPKLHRIRAGDYRIFYTFEEPHISLLMHLCDKPNRIFITADANQSIYGSGFNWADVHERLHFQGRTAVLRANYRSTREIGEAAQSYLAAGVLDNEPVERMYMNSGPMPAVRTIHSGGEEVQLLSRFLPAAAREFRLGIGACAVLCPTEKAGRAIAAELIQRGIEANFMRGAELNLSRPGVKVLTLNSAKGLEFPIVVLAGFINSGWYGHVPGNVTEKEREEFLAIDRRTMFVGMTRAMRALLVTVPAGTRSSLLQGFDATYWNLGG